MPYALNCRGREYTVAERDRLVRGSGEKPVMVEGLGKCIASRFFLINKVLGYLPIALQNHLSQEVAVII
jgi:hypothetical protein